MQDCSNSDRHKCFLLRSVRLKLGLLLQVWIFLVFALKTCHRCSWSGHVCLLLTSVMRPGTMWVCWPLLKLRFGVRLAFRGVKVVLHGGFFLRMGCCFLMRLHWFRYLGHQLMLVKMFLVFLTILIGRQSAVISTLLGRSSKLMPMSRGRIFLSRGLPDCELPVYKVAYPQDAWKLAEDEVQLYCLPNMDEKEMLGEFRFLPASIRRVAASYMTPRDLVALRVVDSGVLPTLVASYRFQCELSVDHLLRKGIFTWMLPSAFGPRFIDAFEAAWIFGFGHKLVLPGFPKAAMHCIGNCVAPVQAAQVWWLVWQHFGFRCLAPSFEALLKAMVLGRPPLSCFRRIECGEQWFLASQTRTCLPAQSDVLVVTDGVVQPFRGEVGQQGEILQERFIATAGNLVVQKTMEDFEPVLDDLHVTVLARLRPLLVVLSKGTLRFSLLSSMRFMLHVLTKVCDRFPFQPWNLEQQLHIMRTPVIRLDFCLAENDYVTVVSQDFAHRIQFVEGLKLSQLVDRVFPFGLQVLDSQAWSCKEQCWVPVQECTARGAVYQLEFAPMQVLVEPFGFLRLNPEMKIYEVQDYCSKRFFGDVTAVFLQANGLFLNGDIALCRATAIGVIRAQIFQWIQTESQWPTRIVWWDTWQGPFGFFLLLVGYGKCCCWWSVDVDSSASSCWAVWSALVCAVRHCAQSAGLLLPNFLWWQG